MTCTDENCARRIAALERENAMLATDNDLMTEKAKQAFRAEQAAKNKVNGQLRSDPQVAEVRAVVEHWRAGCGHPKAVGGATAADHPGNAGRPRRGAASGG